MAVFPGGVVNFGAERLDGDYIPASDINLVRAEVMAIETALGASLANIPSSADLVRVNYLVNGGFDFARRAHRRPNIGTTVDVDTSIMIFHGNPKPDSVNDSVVLRYWN